ncbi:uncharacterized protein BJ171DRAFT_553759 [Polychytrium aggregatum]|uniref:uncharacterized protein n=1 Tax=Polychytrium aggregatum TaxID=110093 RepID=UPI0022FE9547|nr:uncharacterized protein BJ171DRAFT_553759 [Polychytrium aggregatum]KAI9183766.1 hypothetical protein BJ171DRAFT_553759 [Polychytrium aggregatum]
MAKRKSPPVTFAQIAKKSSLGNAQENITSAHPRPPGPQPQRSFIVALVNAANTGCVSSMAKLAYHYAKGDGVEKNDVIASKWFIHASKHGHLPSQYALGVRYQNGIGLPIDHVRAARLLTGCLEKLPNGSTAPIEQYLTNDILDQQDLVLAAKAYSILAARNNAEAQFRLGRCYRDGIGVPKNHQEAFCNFRKAAEAENLTGCFEVGMCYLNGIYVDKDSARCLKWLVLAADGGLACAQNVIGTLYFDGIGITRDSQVAFSWFKKAADQGHVSAQYNIACAYYEGDGVEKDYHKAFEFFSKAASQSFAEGISGLATCYHFGRGTSRSIAKAFELHVQAATLGSKFSFEEISLKYFKDFDDNQVNAIINNTTKELPSAMRHLARRYSDGVGFARNPEVAKELYARGAELALRQME